ncbi:MAG: protoporphyrinogen oxidase [Planctomycetaceae bacterium]|nr:protoporphyrinogen oxidase [Planctomycetaceae bacterium]
MSSDSSSGSNDSAASIAVIGGGITGLASAHRLMELSQHDGRSVSIQLLEASGRLGGVFGTERIGEYLIERGADSFITNKPGAIQLCERLGLSEQIISTNEKYRRSLILHHGKPVPTPAGFNLLAPSQIWPMVTTPLLSWRGKLRVAKEYFLPANAPPGDESLADFVRRRFGQEALDRIVQPMVGGIYTSDPEKLSLRATLPRFPEMERDHGSVIRGLRRSAANASESASGARYGLFASLRDGMSTLLDALGKQIQKSHQLELGQRVDSVHQLADGTWTIQLSDGTPRPGFAAVILALPTYRAASLLEPVSTELATSLNQIEYASSAIVVTGHSLADIEHPLDAFGLVIPHCEGRRILATSFLSRKLDGRAPMGKVILRTFVGGAMQPEEYEHSDGEVIETVLAELHSIFGVKGEPDFAVVARYPQGMPQYTIGHLDRVAEIQRLAKSFPTLALAGNGYRGVGLPDCIQSGETAAEKIWATLTP